MDKQASRNLYLTIGALALGLRVLFVIFQIELQVFDISFDAADSSLYRSLAENLRAGEGFAGESGPTAYVTPGYALFLAALYSISSSTLFIALVQAVLGAATAVALAAIGLRLGGRATAWITGIASAVYPHLIFWTGYVLTETLYVFLLVSAAYLMLRAYESRSNYLATAAGLTTGAAFLARPIVLGLALLVVGAGFAVKQYRAIALMAGATLLLVVGAWTVRNLVVLDAVVVTSTESGFVLWQGNSPGATGGTRGYVDGVDFDPLEFADDTDEVERDRIYMREAVEWMTENPGRVLRLVPSKLWNQFRPTYEGASLFNSLVTYVSYLPLLVGGLIGLYLGRRQGFLGWFLFAFFVYHLLVHATVTGMIRFRLPIEAMLMPSFGYAVARIFKREKAS